MPKLKSQLNDFPKISAPAARALTNAKIMKMSDLANWTEKDFANLHGMGPKVMGILKAEMKRRKIAFKKH